jgi:hypothetical protein
MAEKLMVFETGVPYSYDYEQADMAHLERSSHRSLLPLPSFLAEASSCMVHSLLLEQDRKYQQCDFSPLKGSSSHTSPLPLHPSLANASNNIFHPVPLGNSGTSTVKTSSDIPHSPFVINPQVNLQFPMPLDNLNYLVEPARFLETDSIGNGGKSK